jgi:two-component system, LytTR family, response regulator
MKITAVVVDDDQDSRMILSSHIMDQFEGIVIAGEAGSVATGVSLIAKTKPDLVLLDISLPDGNAFELLDQLPERNFEVIFITAHNTYAIRAFKLAAIDYLLKPVSFAELDEALRKMESRMQEKYFLNHWKTLFHNSRQQSQYDQKLAIATAEGFLFVELKEIVRLESHSNYTHFYFRNKRKLISSRTLGYYEELLPADKFCRIHHSHIVNTDCVERYIKGGPGGTLVMNDGMELGVSQRKKEDVLKLITKGHI